MYNDFDLNAQFKESGSGVQPTSISSTTVALTHTIYTVTVTVSAATNGSEDNRCSMSSCKGAQC